MSLPILEDRLARFNDPAVHLISGSGTGINGKIEGCVVNFTNWLVGGSGASDDHPCIDPAIRRFAIRLNDAHVFAEWRDELKPFAPRLANTRGDDALMRKRMFMCADWAVRTITPKAFEYWAEARPTKRDEALSWARKLREVAPITDEAGVEAGRSVACAAYAVADAADAAAAAAACAAYDAAAAYAVADAVDAAAAAADAAAEAAAEAAADAAHAFRRAMWDESLAFLGRLIDVGV